MHHLAQRLPPPHPDVVVLALALDWLWGEPPNALHPVVWIGTLISRLERHAPHAPPALAYAAGVGLIGVCSGVAVLPALVIAQRSAQYGGVWRLLEAVALKTTFAWHALHTAGERVYTPLVNEDLDAARTGLRWLVSRDTQHLTAAHLAAAVIESLAENASDSVVAPLGVYVLGGLPAAALYRVVNTLDAMIGYHTARYEYLGKPAARLDDLLNLAPARLTAGLIVLAAGLHALPQGPAAALRRSCRAWQVMQRDHALTASPNAGYPMAAMAGALDVQLEKVQHYTLHATGRLPTPADIPHANQITALALSLAAGLFILFLTHQATRSKP